MFTVTNVQIHMCHKLFKNPLKIKISIAAVIGTLDPSSFRRRLKHNLLNPHLSPPYATFVLVPAKRKLVNTIFIFLFDPLYLTKFLCRLVFQGFRTCLVVFLVRPEFSHPNRYFSLFTFYPVRKSEEKKKINPHSDKQKTWNLSSSTLCICKSHGISGIQWENILSKSLLISSYLWRASWHENDETSCWGIQTSGRAKKGGYRKRKVKILWLVRCLKFLYYKLGYLIPKRLYYTRVKR